MADFEVEVRYNAGTFDYRDRKHGSSDAHQIHAKRDQSTPQAILWELVEGGESLVIDFDKGDGNPFSHSTPQFTARKGTPTTPGTFGSHPDATFRYKVTVVDASGASHSHDPEIMFDGVDPLTFEELALIGGALKDVKDAAHESLEEVVTQAAGMAKLTADPSRLFFPKGINKINIEVDVTPVKVIIDIEGPA